jgi:hypothetical protein
MARVAQKNMCLHDDAATRLRAAKERKERKENGEGRERRDGLVTGAGTARRHMASRRTPKLHDATHHMVREMG